jgi:hypothetical protein
MPPGRYNDLQFGIIMSVTKIPRSLLLGIFVGEEIYSIGRVHAPIRKSRDNIFRGDKCSGASANQRFDGVLDPAFQSNNGAKIYEVLFQYLRKVQRRDE